MRVCKKAGQKSTGHKLFFHHILKKVLFCQRRDILALYRKIVNFLCSIMEHVAILCIIGMVISVMVQVIGRYIFRNSPGWSEEMARQFMIVFSFIGIAIGVRDKVHISMTVFVDFILKKIRLSIEICGKMLIMVLGIMMSVNMGLLFSALRYNRLPGTGIPITWIYFFPTAVGVLMVLLVVYQIYDHLKYGTDEEQALLKKPLKGDDK